jgi:uncharacterized protein (TIGR02246 family)
MCSLAPVIKADATADAKKAIQAAYDKQAGAVARRDAKAVFEIYAPDFEVVSKKGKKTSLANIKASITQLMASSNSINTSYKIQKLVLKGKEGTATIHTHAEIGAPNAGKYVLDQTSEDTWIKAAKGWLLRRSKSLTSKESMNGQALPK